LSFSADDEAALFKLGHEDLPALIPCYENKLDH